MDRGFEHGLSRRRWSALRGHLAGCEDCRARFDRLEHASAALSPRSLLSPAARDRIAAEIVEQPSARARRLRWAAAGVATATAAAALLLLFAPREQAPFRPRGAEHRTELVPGERRPGVRIFCLRSTDSSTHVVAEVTAAEPPIPPPTLRCTMGGELQLAYSTPSFGGLTMVAYSRGPSGRMHHYAPRDGTQAAVPLAADVIDEPLDASTRLEVNHAPGTYDVTVRFFARPIAASDATALHATPLHEVQARLEIAPPPEGDR